MSNLETKPRVGVIGGGIGGLAAARELVRTGKLDVVVYERDARVGGVLHTSHAQGYLREHAANGFLDTPAFGATEPPRSAAELCRELGVELLEAAPQAKKRWIYRHGALHALPASPPGILRTSLLSWRGKLALLGEPFRRRRQAGGGDETMFAFAERRLGREAAEAMVAPFVTGVFGGEAKDLSVHAAFPALAAMESEHGSLVRGMIKSQKQRAREARARGEEPRPGRLAAPVGGVQALVDALAADVIASGGRIATGTGVRAIAGGGSPETEAPSFKPQVVLHSGAHEVHDAVVLAVPAFAAAELLAEEEPELAAMLAEVSYAPIVVVHLGLRRSDVAHPLDGFGFLVAPGEEVRMLGTVFESVIYGNRAPADQVLLRCMFGGSRDPEAMQLGDEELLALARAELGKVLDPALAQAQPVHSNVVRWPRAIAQYTVGHRERVARAEELAQPMGITLAGAAYHGVACNSLVADARRVAREVCTHLGLALGVLLALVVGMAAGGCAGGEKGTGHSGTDTGETADMQATEEGAGEAASGMASGMAGTPAAESVPGSGAGSAGLAGNGPAVTPEGAAPPYVLAATGADGRVAASGRISVTVSWLDAPAEVRRPAGRNACGEHQRPPLAVATLGGVEGAVVRLEGMARGRAPEPAEARELVVQRCRLEPRVVLMPRLGAELLVANLAEERHQITIRDSARDALLASVVLPVVGAEAAVPVREPGVWRVDSAGDQAEPAYVIAPPHPYVAVTDSRGAVRFDEVPAGTYEVVAWHPPVAQAARPLETRAQVSVAAGKTSDIVLPLAPRG